MPRVIVVTGAGQGIGREIALRVAKRGDIVAVIDKDAGQAKETENLIAQQGLAGSGYCADLTQPEEVARVFGQIFESNQRIDALINNAGYYLPKPIEELDVGFWDLVINANMKTAFLCSLEAFKYMKTANYGKIVNMSSGTYVVSSPGLCPYIAAKAGVIGLTRALAKDLGPYNITVNALAPGLVATDSALQAWDQERFTRVRNSRAIRRDQQPGDLVGAVFFLIDPDSDFMTGQTLLLDGGQGFI